LSTRRRNPTQVPGGEALLQRMFTRLGCDGRPPHFQVEFYPYSSLVLTIRRREELVFVRFSDLLKRAPLEVLEGAAALLLSRVYRRRAPRALVQQYLGYARSDRVRLRIDRMRNILKENWSGRTSDGARGVGAGSLAATIRDQIRLC
jgi:hypothetical protein